MKKILPLLAICILFSCSNEKRKKELQTDIEADKFLIKTRNDVLKLHQELGQDYKKDIDTLTMYQMDLDSLQREYDKLK